MRKIFLLFLMFSLLSVIGIVAQLTDVSSVEVYIAEPDQDNYRVTWDYEARLNEPAPWLVNKIGTLVKEFGLGSYQSFSDMDPWQISVLAVGVLSDDSVLVDIKGRRSIGAGEEIAYRDTLISGTRMDIPRIGEEIAGIHYHQFIIQPATDLAGTEVGDLSYLYLLRYSDLEVIPGKHVKIHSRLPLTYELLQGDPYDTLGVASGAVACAPMDGRFRDITLFVDATTTAANTGVWLGLGYMTSTDSITWSGPSSGAYKDSTYKVSDNIHGIRDRQFFMRVTHNRPRWIKFIFFGIDPVGQTVLKSVKATKK